MRSENKLQIPDTCSLASSEEVDDEFGESEGPSTSNKTSSDPRQTVKESNTQTTQN